MKNDMKKGDKVWVYLNMVQAIEKVTVREVYGCRVEVAWVFWDDLGDRHRCLMDFLVTELFPTREALCEHYRKIFK